MLIGFRFKNFRAFLDKQSFSFSASADLMHRDTNCVRTGLKSVPLLSKTAMVFGANASGKSSFVAAIQSLRSLVLHSTSFSAQRFAEHHTPYQFGSPDDATQFEIDLLIEGVRYCYQIAYDSQRVLNEQLLVFQTGKAQRWFCRQFDPVTDTEYWPPFSPSFHGPREMWRKATRPAALFLTTAAQLGAVQLQALLQWFEHHLDFVFASHAHAFGPALERLTDEGFKSTILGLMQSVDINIGDVRTSDRERPALKHGSSPLVPARSSDGQEARHVEFLRTGANSQSLWTRSEHESSGVHRLFGLFGPLIATVKHHKLLVVDDFDLNLHPLVAKQLIKLVNNPQTSRAQLLLIGHNTALMDLAMFRRNEIWLTEIDDRRTSQLFSVSRSSPRKHEHIAKGYLQGRYGGVPSIQYERP